MKVCKKYQKYLKQYLAGEIDSGDESRLFDHIKNCISCQEVFQIHQSLADTQLDLPLPDSQEFVRLREKILDKIRLKESREPLSWYQILSEYFTFSFYKPVVAAVLLLIVFFTGFLSQRFLTDNRVQSKANLLKNIEHTAVKNTDLKAVENSPYIFRNVQFRKIDENNIALSFEVSSHVELISSKNDPLVKEVLVQSLLNPEPLGTRLKSISLTQDIVDPKIKQALIFTLQHDQSLAVRMRALYCLTAYRDDKEVQDAFLKLLKEEESVNMRLMAIDYLVQTNINDQALENTIPYLELGRDAAVRHKLNQYLNIEHTIN